MLDIKFIVENTDYVKESLGKKGFAPENVDKLISTYLEMNKLKTSSQALAEEKNKLSSVLNRESDTMDGIITLPRFIYVTMDTYVQNIQEIESNFNFIFNQGHWSLDVLPNSNLDI